MGLARRAGRYRATIVTMRKPDSPPTGTSALVRKDEPGLDYLSGVSPPLQTAPHRIIGPAYGMTARDSIGLERPLRFVPTKSVSAAAIEAIALQSLEAPGRLDRLGRGRLSCESRSTASVTLCCQMGG